MNLAKLSARQLRERIAKADKAVSDAGALLISVGLGYWKHSELEAERGKGNKYIDKYLAASDTARELRTERDYRLKYHGSEKPVRQKNPLKKGYSRRTISGNISREIRAGMAPKRAVAAAMRSARASYRKRHPNPRASAIPKSVRDFALRHQISIGRDSHGVYFLKEHGQVIETTRSAKPTATQAIAMMRRHLRQHKKEGAYPVTKKNPRRHMSAQARRDFAERMRKAREVKQARKRVAIKRQIRRAGMPVHDPNAPTRVLRAGRRAVQARGMYQIGALTADKRLAWWGGHGFTLLRGDAVGYNSLGQAKAKARNLDRGLVAGIFRSDVAAERARGFLLGKN